MKLTPPIIALHDDIANLGNISATGGERNDANDHILSGISRLTSEVSDASEFAPPRDQMIYNEVRLLLLSWRVQRHALPRPNPAHPPTQALKALREQLTTQTSRLGPPSRFIFSPTSKEAFLASISPTVRNDIIHKHSDFINDENDAPATTEKDDSLSPLPSIASKNYNAELAAHRGPGIRKPSFSTARDIDISHHHAMHILLPATAARATTAGRVAALHGCVLDMSVPTTTAKSLPDGALTGTPAGRAPHPFASLTINDVERSLVVAGHVAGPAHITGVRDSVLVVNARQVRMHECENVRVWLWCGSRPIIEDCKGVQFAVIPSQYVSSLPPAGPFSFLCNPCMLRLLFHREIYGPAG